MNRRKPEPPWEPVGLDALEPPKDDTEVQEQASSDPALDSPGDVGVIEQEELLEGLSSESLPSGKLRTDAESPD